MYCECVCFPALILDYGGETGKRSEGNGQCERGGQSGERRQHRVKEQPMPGSKEGGNHEAERREKCCL